MTHSVDAARDDFQHRLAEDRRGASSPTLLDLPAVHHPRPSPLSAKRRGRPGAGAGVRGSGPPRSMPPAQHHQNAPAAMASSVPPPSWIVHKCAQLESQILKLRRENAEWTRRFRAEAKSRATVLLMRRQLLAAESESSHLDAMLRAAEAHAHENDLRARRAEHEGAQWKTLADSRHVEELEQSKIEDMLWKPKFDFLDKAHNQLEEEHNALRNSFENLFEDYLDLTSKASRRFRPKPTAAQLAAAADKANKNAKKKAGQRPKRNKPKPKQNKGKKKKKGKFGPQMVVDAARERRVEYIARRKKRMSIHTQDLIQDCRRRHQHQSVGEDGTDGGDMPSWAADAHLVQVLPVVSTGPASVLLPFQRYRKKTSQPPTGVRVAYVDYDRLVSLVALVYRAAIGERFGRDISPTSEESGAAVPCGSLLGRLGRTLGDVLRECLTKKYGLRSVVEGYLYGVAEALARHAEENLHVEFFARCVGVVDPDLYSPRLGAVFMRLLRALVDSEDQAVELLTGHAAPKPKVPASDGGVKQKGKRGKYEKRSEEKEKKKKKKTKQDEAEEAAAKQETNAEAGGVGVKQVEGKIEGGAAVATAGAAAAAPTGAESLAAAAGATTFTAGVSKLSVPLARALQAVDSVFPTVARAEFMLAHSQLVLREELREKLVKTLRRLSVPSKSTMEVDVNLVLVCCVDAWTEQHEDDVWEMGKMWKKRRLKEDKALDFRVFADAVRFCSDGYDQRASIPEDLLVSMWQQVLCTKDTGLDLASRDGFAVVCSAWGVIPQPPPPDVEPGRVDPKKK